jgi:hypothetical protein
MSGQVRADVAPTRGDSLSSGAEPPSRREKETPTNVAPH